MRCLNVIILIFMSSFSMLTTNVASANNPAENSQILPQTIRTDPNGLHRLELLRAEMSSPKNRKEEESKDKLRRMIEQVRSVRFKTEVEAVDTPIVHDEAPVHEPNEMISVAPPHETEVTKKTKVEKLDKGISYQTLTLLKDSLQSIEKVNDPLELGEILFSTGHTKDAAHFYQEALKRTDPNNVRLSQDRAWILFQMGNCLRNQEPPTAAEVYRKLLMEYPDSPWSVVAKVQRDLIAWRLKERPHELIKESEKLKIIGIDNR